MMLASKIHVWLTGSPNFCGTLDASTQVSDLVSQARGLLPEGLKLSAKVSAVISDFRLCCDPGALLNLNKLIEKAALPLGAKIVDLRTNSNEVGS